MFQRIHKVTVPLKPHDGTIVIPKDATVLSAAIQWGAQGRCIAIWYSNTYMEDTAGRDYAILFTGEKYRGLITEDCFVSTIIDGEQGLVYHVFIET